MELLDKIEESKQFIQNVYGENIDVAIILGTGLGNIISDIKNKKIIKYSDIPNFSVSTVTGHAGELIIGDLSGKKVLALNGRFHYYEGYTMEDVTFPVRVIKALGINSLIVSNASGGMNPLFKAGDLMIITDHINLIGNNPLIGKNYEELGPRFPDMSNVYDKELINIMSNCAERLNIEVQKGVYVAVSGPNYETSAELRMLRMMGADAVGMSTVPEVIVARHMGMKILGISCITDMAIAENLKPLDHKKVVDTANKSMGKFIALVKETIEAL